MVYGNETAETADNIAGFDDGIPGYGRRDFWQGRHTRCFFFRRSGFTEENHETVFQTRRNGSDDGTRQIVLQQEMIRQLAAGYGEAYLTAFGNGIHDDVAVIQQPGLDEPGRHTLGDTDGIAASPGILEQ